MNILTRSPYQQKDGWGRAAINYLKALYRTNHNIRSESVQLAQNADKDFYDWVRAPEKNFIPDIFIQQSLPPFFEKKPDAQNIALCFTETRNLKYTGWIKKFNSVDQVWVATDMEKVNLTNDGVIKPINVVPTPIDFIYSEPVPYFSEFIEDRYTFYYVGEYVERKNIEALIQAYWREFKNTEDVLLIIKTNFGNISTEELSKAIQQNLAALKNKMRLHYNHNEYPEVIFIPEHLSDAEMSELHATCNCFVNPSRGESTCMPLVEAAFHNKPIICTAGISCCDPAFKIIEAKSREVPCSALYPPIQNIYTGWETWMEIDIIDLQEKMRMVYVTNPTPDIRKEVLAKHDIKSVQRKISGLLQ